MNKAAVLEEIYLEQAKCTQCPRLVEHRTQVVRGRGDPNAKILIVGEAPGGDEDEGGVAFVGRAGQTLDEIIDKAAESMSAHIGINRGDFYMINSVSCRPVLVNDLDDRVKLENTRPTAEEINACHPWLHKLIRTLDPLVIIASGATACSALGITGAISKIRGKMTDVTIDGVEEPIVYPVMAIYHPSYLNRMRDKPHLKTTTIYDLQKLMSTVWAFTRVGRGMSPVPLEGETP